VENILLLPLPIQQPLQLWLSILHWGLIDTCTIQVCQHQQGGWGPTPEGYKTKQVRSGHHSSTTTRGGTVARGGRWGLVVNHHRLADTQGVVKRPWRKHCRPV